MKKILLHIFGDFRGLCVNLRHKPEDWTVGGCQIFNEEVGVSLWTGNGFLFLNFYEDSRSLPFLWRPIVWHAFQRGQQAALNRRINLLGFAARMKGERSA
jgi:hypothetical protein